jgi:hypothetical protein
MKYTFLLLISSIIYQSLIGQQLTPFKDESGNFGFIDENQNLLIPALFTVVKPFSENLAVAAISGETGDKYGFINTSGEWIIEPKYFDANGFSQGLAAVYLNDQWSFIDHQGNQAFSLTFDHADKFEKGGCWVNYQGYEKYFSRTGKIYSEYQNDPILRQETGLTVVVINEKYGLMDSIGNEIIAPQFHDLLWNQEEKHFTAYLEDREAKLDNEFKIIPKVYASQKKEKFGFVDFYGNIIVDRVYDSADETDHNLHIVSIKKKFGLVDAAGKEIVPCIYDQIDYFFEGHSTATLNNVEYDIDQFGHVNKKQ